MSKTNYRLFARLSVVMLAFALLAPLVASAATVTSGNLAIGDPRPSQVTGYTFSASGFTTGTQVRCAALKFSTAADGTGTVPGMTTTSSTLTSSSAFSGFTVDNGTAGTLKATSASLTTPASSGNIIWAGVTNGNTADTTYYATFTTHVLQNCTGAAIDTTVLAFVYKDGALVSLTVDPTLTFTVAGVASAQTVNSATTNITTTATAIDFGRTATASVKGVSAHNLTVATNATGGFTVYLRQTGTGLTNGTTIITPWTGINTAPTTFPAAGTTAWGYTTEDSSLSGGTATRFTSASNWAGMPTTNEIVMDSTTGGSQTTKVGHQLGISSTTPAGSYSTTLVYTASGVY